VRRFIDVDELIRLWPQMWLPAHGHTAWRGHICRLRGVELDC
jgi:hypothetical protein